MIALPKSSLRPSGNHHARPRCAAAPSSVRVAGYACCYRHATDPHHPDGWHLFERGAFDRSLKDGRRIELLCNHDPQRRLAATGGQGLLVGSDSHGLYFTTQLRASNPDGEEIADDLSRGHWWGCSTCYRDRRGYDVGGLRVIADAELLEISIVEVPAIQGCVVVRWDDLKPQWGDDMRAAELEDIFGGATRYGAYVAHRRDAEALARELSVIRLRQRFGGGESKRW